MLETASSVWSTIVQEFSDIPDAAEATRILLRLAIATLLGAAIGYERERRGKEAGLRTHMLVSLGAAIFVLVPLQSDTPIADISRVLQGIITGIGFLGGGAIIKFSRHQEIKGLTTAATIWVAAAIGIAAGMGQESTAVVSTLATLFILIIVGWLEDNINTASTNAPDHTESSKRSDETDE